MNDRSSPQNAPGPHFFNIVVDGNHIRVEEPTLTGAQIKNLVSRPANYQLFLERPGQPDEVINDGQLVPIRSGERFHTVPPAQFG